MKSFIKCYLLKFFFISIVVISHGVYAEKTLTEDSVIASRIITQRLSEYINYYPDIHFILYESNSRLSELKELTTKLGAGASNVDYEHPGDVRELLLQTQIARIALMLENSMPSSTLFKTGQASNYKKPYVCLLTLDINSFTTETLASTRFMSDGFEQMLSDYPNNFAIQNIDFLLFSLNHEVFHCLDSYLNGAVFKMTYSELEACYYRFRSEQRADIFAALSHRISNSEDELFLQKIKRFRTLALSIGDFEHYSSPVLEQSILLDKNIIPVAGTRPLVNFAMDYADKIVAPFGKHITFMTSAVYAMTEEGLSLPVNQPLLSELSEYAFSYDPKQINEIKNEIKLATLFFSASLN